MLVVVAVVKDLSLAHSVNRIELMVPFFELRCFDSGYWDFGQMPLANHQYWWCRS